MKKILVIEDDNILQQAIRTALGEAGFEVSQAFDGEEGLAKAKQEKPHLILLDLLLPKKQGQAVLKDIKRSRNIGHVPVYIFTVVEDETSMAECLAAGANGYFLKSDYSLEEIVDKVKSILR